jgi:hypothetical protein
MVSIRPGGISGCGIPFFWVMLLPDLTVSQPSDRIIAPASYSLWVQVIDYSSAAGRNDFLYRLMSSVSPDHFLGRYVSRKLHLRSKKF